MLFVRSPDSACHKVFSSEHMNVQADLRTTCVNMQLCFNYCGLVYERAHEILALSSCKD